MDVETAAQAATVLGAGEGSSGREAGMMQGKSRFLAALGMTKRAMRNDKRELWVVGAGCASLVGCLRKVGAHRTI
jgi:hypothetical protein